MSDTVACPLCLTEFPADVIETHAATCDGTPPQDGHETGGHGGGGGGGGRGRGGHGGGRGGGGGGARPEPVAEGAAGSVMCPLCSFHFRGSDIERHAGGCDGSAPKMTGGGGAPSAASDAAAARRGVGCGTCAGGCGGAGTPEDGGYCKACLKRLGGADVVLSPDTVVREVVVPPEVRRAAKAALRQTRDSDSSDSDSDLSDCDAAVEAAPEATVDDDSPPTPEAPAAPMATAAALTAKLLPHAMALYSETSTAAEKEAAASVFPAVEVRAGDLLREDVACIVNAANGKMDHASGVAGAIRRMGGDVIDMQCQRQLATFADRKVPTGECIVTSGGALRQGTVVHAVGPMWRGGASGEDALLSRCVTNALAAAAQRRAASVALPAISSGIFGFPKEHCGATIIAAAAAFLGAQPEGPVRLVRLTNNDAPTVTVFRKALGAWADGRSILDDEGRPPLSCTGPCLAATVAFPRRVLLGPAKRDRDNAEDEAGPEAEEVAEEAAGEAAKVAARVEKADAMGRIDVVGGLDCLSLSVVGAVAGVVKEGEMAGVMRVQDMATAVAVVPSNKHDDIICPGVPAQRRAAVQQHIRKAWETEEKRAVPCDDDAAPLADGERRCKVTFAPSLPPESAQAPAIHGGLAFRAPAYAYTASSAAAVQAALTEAITAALEISANATSEAAAALQSGGKPRRPPPAVVLVQPPGPGQQCTQTLGATIAVNAALDALRQRTALDMAQRQRAKAGGQAGKGRAKPPVPVVRLCDVGAHDAGFLSAALRARVDSAEDVATGISAAEPYIDNPAALAAQAGAAAAAPAAPPANETPAERRARERAAAEARLAARLAAEL